MNNPNHPKQGSTIWVHPIREIEHIKAIEDLLSDNPRNLCLFILGINTNLRASDLVNIEIGHVAYLNAGDEIYLKEKKSKKPRCITLNQKTIDSISNLLQTFPDIADTEPLFQSRKGGAITSGYITALVKGWCRDVGIKGGNYGAHTLRKTFGYIHRTIHCTDIPTLMEMFNHSNQKQTLAYLGIQPTEIKDAYMKEI